MTIDCSILRNRLASIEVDELTFYCTVGQNGSEYWCNQTFKQVLESGKLEELMIKLGEKDEDCLFNRGEPMYTRCKPIKPVFVNVFSDHVRLRVIGHKTDRIRSKWEDRYAQRIGVPVTIEWEEEIQGFQSRGGKND